MEFHFVLTKISILVDNVIEKHTRCNLAKCSPKLCHQRFKHE